MLLRGQSWCFIHNSSMVGLQSCLWLTCATSRLCNSGSAERREGIRTVGSTPAGNRAASQKRRLANVVSRGLVQTLDKVDSGLSKFVRKLTKDPFWLNHQPKPEPASSGLAALVAEIRSRREGMQEPTFVKPVRQDDDFESVCEEGHLDKALDALLRMEQQGIVPPVKMYRCLLRACAKRKDLAQAKRTHDHISGLALDSSKLQFLGECAVSTFVKCGGLEDALEAFNGLPRQNVFSWTTLISGYSMSGRAKEALGMYRKMEEQGVQPNTYTLVALLKACGIVRDLNEGRRIHAEAVVKYRKMA